MTNPPVFFDPKISSKKGVQEGGAADGVATLLMLIMGAVKANNPNLGLTPSGEAAIIGVGTAAITGIFKGFRNWLKHRRQRRAGM